MGQFIIKEKSGRAGRAYIIASRQAFKEYEERTDFTYLVGLPMKVILGKVENLPGQTFVIYLLVIVDGAGKKFVAIGRGTGSGRRIEHPHEHDSTYFKN